jgi:hypothetical protein
MASIASFTIFNSFRRRRRPATAAWLTRTPFIHR